MTDSPAAASFWRRNRLRPPRGLESLRTRLLVLGAWLLLGLLEATKEWVAARTGGGSRPWDTVVLVNVSWWLFWAFATPAIFVLARRFDLAGAGRVRAALVHGGVSVALAVVHLWGVGALSYYAVVRGGDFIYTSVSGQAGFLLQGYLVLDAAVYWIVLGAFHAFRTQRRLHEGRLREARYAERAARAEARAAESRLAALRMELNPHFLFNALNGVAGLVRRGDDRAATAMLARLSELLRLTLRPSNRTESTLRAELDLLGRYLEIERLRFGERLTVVLEADEAARGAAVPPLLLQPLVENAVKHGVAEVRGRVRVEVRGEVVGSRLRLEVRDSGPGWPEEAVSEGTGLRNVRERLFESFGSEASLTVQSGKEGGAVARVELPYRPVATASTGEAAVPDGPIREPAGSAPEGRP